MTITHREKLRAAAIERLMTQDPATDHDFIKILIEETSDWKLPSPAQKRDALIELLSDDEPQGEKYRLSGSVTNKNVDSNVEESADVSNNSEKRRVFVTGTSVGDIADDDLYWESSSFCG